MYKDANEIINNDLYDYVVENKTRKKYAVNKFMQYHKYNSTNNTIDVGDGRRVTVDKGKKLAYKADGPGKGTIEIDDRFWRLKNQARRESALQHEVGHGTLHYTNGPLGDKSSMTTSVHKDVNKHIKELSGLENLSNNALMNKLIALGASDEKINGLSRENMIKLLTAYAQKKLTGVDDLDAATNTVMRPDREEKYLSNKKYVGKSTDHGLPLEMDADDYAAKHVKGGSGTVKKAVSQYIKLLKKDINKTQSEDDKHTYNRETDDELMRRMRHLRDKGKKK